MPSRDGRVRLELAPVRYESAARAEEALALDVANLDTANRCAVLVRVKRVEIDTQAG